MRNWISISGLIEANVNSLQFNEEFIEWVESKNWIFAGVVKDEDTEE